MDERRIRVSRLAALALMAGWLPVARPQSAFQCSMLAQGHAQVRLENREVTLPVVLDDCAGTQVVRGQVSVCVAAGVGEVTCRSFGEGELVDRAHFALRDEGAGGWLAGLKTLLAGNATSATAISRGSTTDLPSGRVALYSGSLHLDFTRGLLQDVDHVEFVEAGGGSIAKVTGPGVVELPASKFQPGKSYQWFAPDRPPLVRSRSDSFTMIDSQLASELTNELRRLEAAKFSAQERAVMKAIWLNVHGLTYDAKLALRADGLDAP